MFFQYFIVYTIYRLKRINQLIKALHLNPECIDKTESLKCYLFWILSRSITEAYRLVDEVKEEVFFIVLPVDIITYKKTCSVEQVFYYSLRLISPQYDDLFRYQTSVMGISDYYRF